MTAATGVRTRVQAAAASPWLLAAMCVAYVAVFLPLVWVHQSNYGTFGFDMGIHDQGIWLLSRFEDPFVTIRGMDYLGHHMNLVAFLLVPFYWLGAGPHFLYAVETVVLALGAVPLWLLARDRIGGSVAPATAAAAYLLFPSVQWINWWHFHPDALAITPLLFAVWCATRARWRWFAVCIALALSTKEDVALAVTMLGVVLAIRSPRRVGLVTAAVGIGWFLACQELLIPLANDGNDPFYGRTLFTQFGDSPGEVVAGMATNPDEVLRLATEPGRLTYYTKLLAPVGFLPLLGLPWLLVAGPQLGVNVLSNLPGTHDIRFHYSAVVVAAIFAALVSALGILAARRRARALHVACAAVLACSVWSNVSWSPSPIGREFDSGIWARTNPRSKVLDAAVAMVPPDAGVATSYGIAPHLTHRRFVYEWPNPWRLVNWGVFDQAPPDTGTVDYVVLDRRLRQDEDLLASLTQLGGPFEVISEREDVLVARRVRPD